ncbi:MAG: Shedu immune nuclease family protein [Abditibacteriaceae bacterium]
MPTSYKTNSTSARSADVEDIWLDVPDSPDSVHTRRILRAEIVDNTHNPEAGVKACIRHQKRHSKNQPWEDVEAFNLAKLKASEEIRLQLNAAETYQLSNELQRLHKISEQGVPKGQKKLIVADEANSVIVQGSHRGLIKQLLDEASDDVWEVLTELHPNLFRAIALVKLHEVREQAVEEFEEHLISNDWDEPHWQSFFEKNTWIFGYGLSYRFLSTIESQPHYGGTNYTGKDSQRGDFLTVTEAERQFTVIVEIKRANTLLLLNKLYRNKTHMIGGEVAGGVAQVQSNCQTWAIEGSQTADNRELLDQNQKYTIQPKGILIIGHTGQLDTIPKRTTFELFRRNLQNPEIITFDELLERARHLLLTEKKELKGPEAGNL